MAITMFVIALYLSTNDGTSYTYYIQLLFPYFILVAVQEWNYLPDKMFVLCRPRQLACVLIVQTVLISSFIFMNPKPEKYFSEYNRLYEDLDARIVDVDKVKVDALPLSFYCLEKGIYSDNYGHSNCYSVGLLNKLEKSDDIKKMIFHNI